jgi:hypothetical protein
LGNICREQGDYAAAQEAYREALSIFSDLGHRRGLARCLEGCAFLAVARGDAARALKLAAAATHLRHLISAPLPEPEQEKLDQALLPAWNSLSELEGKEAWHQGSAMSVEEAMQCASNEPRSLTAGQPGQ